MRLQGKVALITGGTSGIGLATAKRFQEEGASVAITGRDDGRLADAMLALGGKVLSIKADARSASDMRNAVEQVHARCGRLDILFANAGVAVPRPLEAIDEAHLDDHLSSNVKSVVFAVQQAVPVMGRGGSIVLNTSWLGEVGTPGLSVLSASKAAVRSLTRSLAAELAHRGIRVNAVSPGPIDTPIYGKMGLPPETLQVMAGQIQGQVPMGRFGMAEEIAGAALFLASDESSFMLGAEIVVDGGLSQI